MYTVQTKNTNAFIIKIRHAIDSKYGGSFLPRKEKVHNRNV